jgi:hypothetical protein
MKTRTFGVISAGAPSKLRLGGDFPWLTRIVGNSRVKSGKRPSVVEEERLARAPTLVVNLCAIFCSENGHEGLLLCFLIFRAWAGPRSGEGKRVEESSLEENNFG